MPKGLIVTRLSGKHSHQCECLLTKDNNIVECAKPAAVRVEFEYSLSTPETYCCEEHYRRRVWAPGDPEIEDLPLRRRKPMPKVKYNQKRGCYVDGDGLNHLDEHGDPGA